MHHPQEVRIKVGKPDCIVSDLVGTGSFAEADVKVACCVVGAIQITGPGVEIEFIRGIRSLIRIVPIGDPNRATPACTAVRRLDVIDVTAGSYLIRVTLDRNTGKPGYGNLAAVLGCSDGGVAAGVLRKNLPGGEGLPFIGGTRVVQIVNIVWSTLAIDVSGNVDHIVRSHNDMRPDRLLRNGIRVNINRGAECTKPGKSVHYNSRDIINSRRMVESNHCPAVGKHTHRGVACTGRTRCLSALV
ncbi:hypothetical protein ES703_98344 [subsurface metagenome]